MKLDHLPAPEDVMDEPQLSAVVALETTLLCTVRALLAAHPALFPDTFPRTMEERDHWAERVVDLGTQLFRVLEKYIAALYDPVCPAPDEPPHDPDGCSSAHDDVPF